MVNDSNTNNLQIDTGSKLLDTAITSRTESIDAAIGAVNRPVTYDNISDTAKKFIDAATQPVLIALSDAWLGIGLWNPASTDDASRFPTPDWAKRRSVSTEKTEAQTPTVDRFDYTKLWSLQIGDYFMPLSQTFTLQAEKRLNVSSLVDGVDIIQQTRKSMKTIDCSLRLTLRDNQPELSIVKENKVPAGLPMSSFFSEKGGASRSNGIFTEIATLAKFLKDFYENDAILAISNKEINETFGVQYAFMTKFKFSPRTGMGTYTFDFTLTEVMYGENVLTFNLREINSDTKK